MSIQRLETSAAKYVQTFPLSTLDGAVVGVDASYYLDLCLNENKEEPLKSALGGTPFCLRARVEDDIQAAKDAGVTLLFVFNGLDYVNKTPPTSESLESRKAHEEGWSHYMAGDASSPVQDFGKAKYPLDIIYRYFRKILYNKGVQYMVAPFSSLAWLAYLYAVDEGQPIDAIMASSDAFLFDVDKVILNFDAKEQIFSWLKKSDCEDAAGRTTAQTFKYAQLLLGSSFLPHFPGLERPPAKANPSIRDAVELLNRAGNSVHQLCNQYREDPMVQSLDYMDRYRKALLTIKHHIIMTSDGSLEPLDFDHAPGDVHAFVGQRLPDELFFYISRGLLAPHVANWLTTGEINLVLPGGVMDSEPYRRLVIEQLNPLRLQVLKLLAESLHYYYQGRVIEYKTWDGRDTTPLRAKLRELPSIKEKASQWRVPKAAIPDSTSAHVPSFLACLKAVKDSSFAQKSIARGKIDHPALTSPEEILSNVFWRFLHIRGYIDDKHQLTVYGNMLDAALTSLDGGLNKEEVAVIGIELMRLGLLNSNSVTGVAVIGQDKASKNTAFTNLISKVACLGRLKHEAVGYVGPLDRSLLTFAWMVTSVRVLLRDLVETILVTMFLNGDVSRDRDDWFDLPQRLPFISDNGSSLGIAVKTYLDALNDSSGAEPSEELKESVKKQEDKYDWFQQVKGGTLHKSLESAFKLFDVMNAAVKAGGKEARDANLFADADEWLASRR